MNFKKQLILVLWLFASSSISQAQTLMHYWHFNTFNSGFSTATNPDNLSPYRADYSLLDTSLVNVAFKKLDGTSANYTTFWDGAATGDTTNLRLGQTAGQYLRLRNPTDSMQLVFKIPSTGYQNISINYAIQRSSAGNGATINAFSYSIDGGLNWITTGLSRDTINTSAAWRYPAADIKINNPAANNNPNLMFRILFVGTQNTGTSGNCRIDNFSVDGDPYVAPAPVLLHYWHFNNFNSGIASATDISNLRPYRADSSLMDTSLVRVSFEALSGTVGNFRTYWDNVIPGDTTNLRGGITGLGAGLRPRNPTDSMQLVWKIPSNGYSSPKIKFASQKSSANNGAAVLYLSYSVDGGLNWIKNGLSIDSFITNANWISTPTIEIANTNANDNANLMFRIVFGGPGNTGTSGNIRIDNFSVDAISLGGGSAPVADTFPPLASFSPINNANLVSRTTNPTISFNEKVWLIGGAALSSANAASVIDFRLNDSIGPQIPATLNVSANGRVITITPDTLLGYNTAYYVGIKQNTLKDSVGNLLAGRPFSRFSTEFVQTQFVAGDLLPLAYRTNASGSPDEIALLTFVDIMPGTQIRLTDAKYTTNNPAQCPGGFVWTAPMQGVSAGTTLIISTDNGTANLGSVTGSTFGLSSGGDQVIVYTGTNVNPNYITALSSIDWVSANTVCNGSLSMIPQGLTNYTNAFSLNQVNAFYNGTQIGSIPQLKAAILDTANWIGVAGGTAPQQWPVYNFFGPPSVRSASILNANTIQVVYSADMDSLSAVNTANYAGISNLQSISFTSNGSLADTVLLNFSSPFASGQTYTLVISGVKDVQQRAMLTAYSYTFQYSTSISWNNDFISVKEEVGNVSIRLNLNNPNNSSVTVALKPAPWTNATPGSDFSYSTQVLQFTGGSQSTQTLTIPIINDALKESDEYFVLELTNPYGLTILGNPLLTVFIKDNDNIAPTATKSIELVHKYSFDPSPLGSSTEVIAYDSLSKRLFATSAIQNRVDIVNFSNPENAVTIGSIDMTPYGGLTSIAVRNGIVAVASPNANEQLNGSVVFFDFNGTYINKVTVGALPDMICFTPDGKKVLTADEGQPNNAYTIDPEGSISIIDISGGIQGLNQTKVKTLDFQRFNVNEAALITAGIRKTKSTSTLSQDLEPEYITVNEQSTKAWVSLQENNAMAEIDLNADSITQIWPLGVKDLSLTRNALDASDVGGAIHLSNWPLKAFHMPDALANYTVNGITYVITANEGDEKEYAGLNDRTTVGNNGTRLDSTVFPHAAWLKLPYNLGRFRITNLNGDTDGDGDYDELYTVGSRSFSIINTQSKQMVYESGGDIELITSQHPKSAPVFNANHEGNAPKGRSHSKGPEPEAVCIAQINGKHFAFVGLERVGGVLVYDVSDPANPIFVDYDNTRNLSSYGGDNGPEITLYISASQSPNGKPYLLVSNEISGTITVFEIKNNMVSASVAFEVPSITVAEDAGTVPVRIQFSQPATSAGQLVIRRTNGANVTATDYTTSPVFVQDNLTLNYNQNANNAAFSVNVLDDIEEESAETISFEIISVSGPYQLGAQKNLTFTITDNDMGTFVNEVKVNGNIVMYPNPNKNGIVQFSEVVNTEVFDMQGRSLIKEQNTKQISVSALPKGMYLVKINGTINQKLVIE